MTAADRARHRTEARRYLRLAAESRAAAAASRNPGHTTWLEYVAEQHVARARGHMASIGETLEHLRHGDSRVETPTPLRQAVVHFDEQHGSGRAACGAEIWPRLRRDLAPAAGPWRVFYSARIRGAACPMCLAEVEAERPHQRERGTHVLG